MNKYFLSVAASFLVTVMLTGLLPARAFGEEISIQISPDMLNLKSRGEWVTVHADIPFSEVIEGTVFLNGLSAVFIKPDDCGDLVAKFDLEEVKDEVGSPGNATLMLKGQSSTGDLFFGSDTIRVIDKGGKD